MQQNKTVQQIDQPAQWPTTARVTGYEIHHGQSEVNRSFFPFAAISDDHQLFGSYIHGLFAQGEFRHDWLQAIGCRSDRHDQSQQTLASLDLLADTLQHEISAEWITPLLQSKKS